MFRNHMYKPIWHFYDDIPSLHGNNSEIGAKTVNIKMSYRFNTYFSYSVSQKFRYYANKTFSLFVSYWDSFVWKCLIHMTSSFLEEKEWLENCLIRMILKFLRYLMTRNMPYTSDFYTHRNLSHKQSVLICG